MKKLKKILTSLLTAVMTVSLAMLTVSAEEGAAQSSSYTIKINNSTTGHTYEAYQIFTGRLNDTGNTLYDIVWGKDVNSEALLTELKGHSLYENCTNARDVAMILDHSEDDSAIAKEFADIVNKYLSVTQVATSTPISGGYEITGLQPGYYLIKDKDNSQSGKSSAYTRVILKLVNDVTIEPKSIIPTFELKVYEKKATGVNRGYGDGIQDVTDACVGDSVPFYLFSKVPDTTGYSKYEMKFTVNLGNFNLEGDNKTSATTISVKIGNKRLTQDAYETKIPGSAGSESQDNELTFTIPLLDSNGTALYSDGDQIEINWKAQLTAVPALAGYDGAVMGKNGNIVSANLDYSNNPTDQTSMGKTGEDKVVVFTYGVKVTKKDGDNNNIVLNRAGFHLYRMNENTKEYFNSFNGEWTIEKPEQGLYWTDENGVTNINGLDDGTYYLEEAVAPDGYIISDKPIEFTISADTVHDKEWDSFNTGEAINELTITANSTQVDGALDTGIVSLDVLNYKGSKLPGTGGNGTIWFTAIGGILIFAGVGYLLISRRKNRRS